MIDLPLLIGLAVGLSVAARLAFRTQERLRRQRSGDGGIGRLTVLRRSIRNRGRQTLLARRTLRLAGEDLARVDAQVAEAADEMAQLEARRIRTYLLDDRRAAGDEAYAFTIRHPDFRSIAPGAPDQVVESWQAGRRCALWAADSERAARRAALRCPPGRGYVFDGPGIPLPEPAR